MSPSKISQSAISFLIIISLFNVFNVESCFSEDLTLYPQRIISLGPAVTESLYLLGAEDRILATTVYCQRPAQAQNTEKIGTVIDVNIEKAVQLKPDLVLATPLTNPKDIEKLQSLGIKVTTAPAAKNFSQICEQLLKLGKNVGEAERAEEIIRQVKARVEIIKKKAGGRASRKVFVQIGANPLYAATKDSFINDFIEYAGGTNIVSSSGSGLYSREKVLADNPDVIIIVIMGIAAEEEKQVWRRFKGLKAASNNRIYIVDADKFCSPTPVSFVEALEEMVRILHPQDG